MYSQLKELALKVIPKSFLFKNEYHFRYFSYLSHKGSTYQCTICEKKLSSFILPKTENLCPRCGSLPRTRRLWSLLKNEFIKPGIKVLDFSPSRSIYRMMKKSDTVYTSSDFCGDFFADVSYDIKSIEEQDATYDLVICFHVLEHIIEDVVAMKELYRVLKNGGHCLIQTPFKEGDVYEDYSITTPEDRLKYFGQDDHVRVYSVAGLQERLERVGFKVDVRKFAETSQNVHGFSEEETILVCQK